MYNDASYARGRLDNTIVCLKDKTPILIEHIANDFTVSFLKLKNLSANKVLNTHFSEVDLTPVPLGYVNSIGAEAVYYMRAPLQRDWHQGLRRANMLSLHKGSHRRVTNTFHYESLYNTIINNYPDLEKVCELLETGNYSSVAVSRNFSVDYKRNIHYKGSFTVGGIHNSRLRLGDKYEWLREQAEGEFK